MLDTKRKRYIYFGFKQDQLPMKIGLGGEVVMICKRMNLSSIDWTKTQILLFIRPVQKELTSRITLSDFFLTCLSVLSSPRSSDKVKDKINYPFGIC